VKALPGKDVRHIAVALAVALGGLGGCGSSDSNPLDNPQTVTNSAGTAGQRLCYAYYQQCVNPIFLKQLAGNTCAASGCHDTYSGTGGAFRIIAGAAALDVTDPANTPEVIQTSDMYKNFYSALGETIVGSPLESRLLAKPLVLGVLHGGGVIFSSAADPDAQVISYWISHPARAGQDEFSTECYAMFSDGNPNTGTCKISD
jgi:hypothetical protein